MRKIGRITSLNKKGKQNIGGVLKLTFGGFSPLVTFNFVSVPPKFFSSSFGTSIVLIIDLVTVSMWQRI